MSTDNVKTIGLDLLDELIIKVTPDDVISKTSELVVTAVDKDMTGKEKFEWVVEQIKPTLSWVISFLAERLVQLMYDIIVAKSKELRA